MGTLYESIISLCDKKGIKGGKMCVDLGISKSTMTDLKSGRRTGISMDTAQKIADYFNVSVDRVLGAEQKEKSPTPEGVGLIPGYSDLTAENKLKAQEYIEMLLKLQ